MPKRVHLICQAHIDPMWMWRMDEGMLETLSTFRCACEFIEQFPGFTFTHNESLLYEFVEAADPELFERIRRHVRSGRWEIAGGWYVQPDVNMPATESIVRQMLVGKTYFRRAFGVDVKVAYNYDSFGHSGGLPQLLRLGGFELYVHTRPTELPGGVTGQYRWVGVDGCGIRAAHPPGSYVSEDGQAAEKLRRCLEVARQTGRDVLMLWGTGDHGGGATRADLKALARHLGHSAGGVEAGYSTLHEYLRRTRRRRAERLPVVRGELKRVACGCYTSLASVKAAHRALENELVEAEKLASLAHLSRGGKYPGDELAQAWRALLLVEFHDILPGSCIQKAEQDALEILGAAREAARRIHLDARWALIRDDRFAEGAFPLYVLNPHSFAGRQRVEVEYHYHHRPLRAWQKLTIRDDRGRVVPCQQLKTDTNSSEMTRYRLSFYADADATSIRRYGITREDSPVRVDPSRPARQSGLRVLRRGGVLYLQNRNLRVGLGGSGSIVRLYDRRLKREFLRGGGIRPVAFEDRGSVWNVVDCRLARRGETFQAAGKADGWRVVESGAVCLRAQARLAHGQSVIHATVTLGAEDAFVDVDLRVYFQEDWRLLKLVVPTNIVCDEVMNETVGGAAPNEADGTERVYQKWLLAGADGAALAVSNRGQYGFDMLNGELRLNILRTLPYVLGRSSQFDHRHVRPFMGKGEHLASFRFYPGAAGQLRRAIAAEAYLHNSPMTAFVAFPARRGRSSGAALKLPRISSSSRAVILDAFKRSEDGRGYVARFREMAGRAARTTLTLAGRKRTLRFGKYQIRSFLLRARRGKVASVTEVDLMERPVRQAAAPSRGR